MQSLKVMIWNDVPNAEIDKGVKLSAKALERRKLSNADDWRKVVEADGFGPVIVSSEKQADTVIKLFETERPDIVLLDIVADDDHQMGLVIAEGIRRSDKLVPIIA